MRATFLLLLVCTGAAAQNVNIDGLVVNVDTSQPMSGVHIRLLGGTPEKMVAYGAMSDRGGHFSIAGIAPATYMLSATYPGFAIKRSAVPVSTITLKPGQNFEGYRLAMTRRAVITGRVVDENGEPVAKAGVRVEPDSAEPENPFDAQFAMTSDRGEFRLSPAPGKFRIRAEWYGHPGALATESQETAYGSTYYPGVLEKERAAVVEATSRSEVSGIEIRLQRRRILSIRGRVTGIPEGSGYTMVTLLMGSDPRKATGASGTGTAQDGSFRFASLRPGRYGLYAECCGGKGELQSRPVEVQLDTMNMENVDLVLAPAGEVDGKVVVEGRTGPPGKLSVNLESVGAAPLSRPLKAETSEEGAFRLTAIPPHLYRVRVTPLPENGYIKSIQLDGAVTAGDLADFSRSGASGRTRITLGVDGGEVSGTIADGDLTLFGANRVFLVTDPEDIRPEGVASPTGKEYSFKAVPPGKYRLFLYDALRSYGFDLIRRSFAEAEEIEVKPGGRIRKDLVYKKEAAK